MHPKLGAFILKTSSRGQEEQGVVGLQRQLPPQRVVVYVGERGSSNLQGDDERVAAVAGVGVQGSSVGCAVGCAVVDD